MNVDASSSLVSDGSAAQVEFVDESDKEGSEIEIDESATVPEPFQHTATIQIELDTEEASTMVRRTLEIDKEPTRSKARRNMHTEGKLLIVNFTSSDRKYLQKSIDNFFDMLDLAKQTLDVIGKYELKLAEEAPAKKKKRKRDE